MDYRQHGRTSAGPARDAPVFRGWLILQGRSVFGEALADPDGLAGLPAVRTAVEAGGVDLRSEYTLYIASDAYRNATGQELPEDVTPAG